MNLNVSMRQIASELDVSEQTAQSMCGIIREGVVKKSLILSLAERLRLRNVMSLQARRFVLRRLYERLRLRNVMSLQDTRDNITML